MKIVIDDDFDCESDMEICPDSEDEENNDIDISEQLQRLEIERQQHEALAKVQYYVYIENRPSNIHLFDLFALKFI